MTRVLRRLFRYRSLLLTLIRRELAARYRGSVLGFLWSLVNPLMLLVVYTFVFNTIFTPRDASVTDHGPYALFLACGVIPWIWLSTAWIEGTLALEANAGLIRKASFPAELLPMVSVLSNLVHFAFALPILLLAFVATGLVDETTHLGAAAFAAPLVVAAQLPFVSGLALGFAALEVHFKDVKDILQNLTTLLFFLTPILYSLEMLDHIPLLQSAVALNPFTPFFRGYQETLFYARFPEPMLWAAMAGVAVVTFAAGAWLFDRLSETLVEAV